MAHVDLGGSQLDDLLRAGYDPYDSAAQVFLELLRLRESLWLMGQQGVNGARNLLEESLSRLSIA